MARLMAVSSQQVKLPVTSSFKSKPIERNLARGSSLWNSPQTISHQWLLLTVLFVNLKGQSFLNRFYCSCWKLSFRDQIPLHGEDAVQMRENWKCWVLQKLKYWTNNFLLYFYESNPTASWWFLMLLVNKHLLLLSKRKRLIIQHWFLCVETEWSLFWCSIYRGLLMYLLRAANKAVIRARQLPQCNSSMPCPGRVVAEPSPGTFLLLKAAGAPHPGWPQELCSLADHSHARCWPHPLRPGEDRAASSWTSHILGLCLGELWLLGREWGTQGTLPGAGAGTCQLLVTPISGSGPALAVLQASQWSPSICKVLDILCLNIGDPGLGCGREGQ